MLPPEQENPQVKEMGSVHASRRENEQVQVRGLPLPTARRWTRGGGRLAHAHGRVGPAAERSGQFRGPKPVSIAREGLGSRSSRKRPVSSRFPAFLSPRRVIFRPENRSPP